MSFEPNQGQTDSQVRFIARANGYALFLTRAEAVLNLQGTVVRMKLVGGNPAPDLEGLDLLPGKSNYFVGNDRKKWVTNVPQYARVLYESVYPGVDLIYYGDKSCLEYDFIVKATANPEVIQLAYEGIDSLQLDAAGDLVMRTASAELKQRRPRVYQMIGGQRIEISARYRIEGQRVAFGLGYFDRSKALVIDPSLAYSTYFGGSNAEGGATIALDAAANVYVAGSTLSSNFPTTQGSYQSVYGGGRVDVFVAKLNRKGTALVYSTFIGGSGDDGAYGLSIDGLGNAYVGGSAGSKDFPTTSGTAPGAFLAKLSSAGDQLVYSTLLPGVERLRGVAVDSLGSAYATGVASSGFRTTPGAFQPALSGTRNAFAIKLNATGTQPLYSTYLGGREDEGYAIAVDSGGSAYLTGRTGGGFPTTPGAYLTAGGSNVQAFAAKLSASGSQLTYSTYLNEPGGTNSIAIDAEGNAYIGGPQILITKLNPTGSQVIYRNSLGVSVNKGNGVVACDAAGNAFIAGKTTANNFPTTLDAFQRVFGGRESAFFVTLNSAGKLVYSTYLGVDSSASALAVDLSGSAYVTGDKYGTVPVTSGALPPSGASSGAVFLAKFEGLTPVISADGSLSAASSLSGVVAPGEFVSIYGASMGPAQGVSSSSMEKALGTTRVYFNGIEAFLTYASAGQVNALVPYEVAGSDLAKLQVEYQAMKSNIASLPVAKAAPGIFTQQYGPGQAWVVNQDQTFNSDKNPAARGSYVAFWATGQGLVDPEGKDGEAIVAPNFPRPKLPVRVTVGGVDAEVVFTGLIYTGVMQVNARVPDNAPLGNAVELLLKVGDFTSRSGVTLAVR